MSDLALANRAKQATDTGGGDLPSRPGGWPVAVGPVSFSECCSRSAARSVYFHTRHRAGPVSFSICVSLARAAADGEKVRQRQSGFLFGEGVARVSRVLVWRN